jgi:hypothetical protein
VFSSLKYASTHVRAMLYEVSHLESLSPEKALSIREGGDARLPQVLAGEDAGHTVQRGSGYSRLRARRAGLSASASAAMPLQEQARLIFRISE